MAQGKAEKEWEQTSLIAFQLANMLNFSGKVIPIEEFNPYLTSDPKSGKVKPSTLRAKVEAHVPKNKRNRKPDLQA